MQLASRPKAVFGIDARRDPEIGGTPAEEFAYIPSCWYFARVLLVIFARPCTYELTDHG